MWIPGEDADPVLWHYPGRKSVGYFGAVRLRDGLGLFQKETGKFEGPTFWPFLQRLRAVSAPSGRTVVVIIDNAKYHHAKLHQLWRDQQAPDFVLDYLPPYSPELNPQENIWQFMRQNKLANRCYENYEAIVDACCEAWNDLIALPNTIKSIASREWMTAVSS